MKKLFIITFVFAASCAIQKEPSAQIHPDYLNTRGITSRNIDSLDLSHTSVMIKKDSTTFPILCLFWLGCQLSCGDGMADYFNPKDAGQIEGFWKRESGGYTTYYFSNGKAVISSWVGTSLVVQSEYSYHTGRDTVYFQKVPQGDGGKWLVRFDDENTANVVAPIDTPSFVFTLKRL